jgi:hypothetical protein
MYGLVGLAAMLVIAFYFACSDQLPSVRENSPVDLANLAVHPDRGQVEAFRG